MMTADKGYMLMYPETVRMICRIQELRKETGLDICFTLDAGPNVHLIYFKDQIEQVNKLIVEDLFKNNKQNTRIDDHYGSGPVKLG
jgi:diphosphomevalonate decarboxylase